MKLGRLLTITDVVNYVTEEHPETLKTVTQYIIQQYGVPLQCYQAKYEVGEGREIGTVYHNTSGKVRIVTLSVYGYVEEIGTTLEGCAGVYGWVKATSPPNEDASEFAQAGVGSILLSGLANQSNRIASENTLVLVVKPDDYYMITEDLAGAGYLSYGWWTETDLGGVS